MEGTSSLLKSVIQAAAQYSSHKTERNLVFLQRQIDVLISKTSRGCSLKFFSPVDVLPAECLACLVSLVGDPGTKATLLLKCLLLINNLVSDNPIRVALHENFQLTPALASVVKYHGASNSDTLTAEALQLLQKVTYGHRISFQEPYMEDLIKFLLGHVTSPSTGLTQPSMGILVHLTRDNFSVQSYIKNNELAIMKDLSRNLTKLLSDESYSVILFSLTLLATLCLQTKIGTRFFSEGNIDKTFRMIFNLLLDGDSSEHRRYAVDLFKDLLKIERLQRSLASYEFLSTSVDQILHLLTSSSPDSVVKVYDLLQTFCCVDGVRLVVCKSMVSTFPLQDTSMFANLAQTPLSRMADPLLATIHWAGQSTDTHWLAPLSAFDTLTDIYEELVFSHDSVHHSKHAAALLPVILQALKTPLEGDNSAIQRKCAKMVKALKLLLTLCGDDNLLTIVSQEVSGSLMAHLLKFQFEHNTVCLKSSSSSPTDDWSATGVDLVLCLLDLVSRLKKQDVEDLFMSTMQLYANACIAMCGVVAAHCVQQCLGSNWCCEIASAMLEPMTLHQNLDSRVVPFLAMGLGSSTKARVQAALSIVCLSSRLEGFPGIILGDCIAYRNAEQGARSLAASAQMPQQSRPFSTDDKENDTVPAAAAPAGRQALKESFTSNHSYDSHDSDIGASIQDLIDKMNSGLEVKDVNSSEIINVYERSLQALQTKEHHLADLLEAKSMALTQADRMLAQYRARKGQDEAESNRLRNLLLQSERKSTALKSEVTDMGMRIEQYLKEIEELNTETHKLQQIAKMHQQLTVAHTELSEKHESLQKSHMTMRQEHKSLTEMHEMLQKHNTNLKQQHDTAMEQLSELQDERRKITAQLKTTDAKLDDMKKASLKWEYDYKRSEEERESMEASVENLRSTMAKTDTKKKELQEKVSQLEFLCTQQEAQVTKVEDELNELRTENNKHRHIAALINSLSSGNPSEASA